MGWGRSLLPLRSAKKSIPYIGTILRCQHNKRVPSHMFLQLKRKQHFQPYWRLPHDASNGDMVDNVILNFVMEERQKRTQSAASELKNVSLIEV